MYMHITFLGTAGSSLTAKRTNPSILIDDDLLIDAGEGTTQKLLQIGPLQNIRTILISHLHVDHFLGLFSLLWHRWLAERDTGSISIFGPPNIQAAIETIFKVTSTPFESFPFTIQYNPLDPAEEILKCGEISATRLLHSIYTLGFRIDRDKSICYTTDTAPLDRVISLAKDCDVLIHDCSMQNKFADMAHKYYHSTPQDAAEIANQAGVKKLVLFHILGVMEDKIEAYKQDAQEFFQGEVIIAKDMKKLEI